MSGHFTPVSTGLTGGKYFIAHSYKDTELRDSLVAGLPQSIDPYIFPAINVSPIEFASNTVVGALLACDGLIFVNGGHSLTSFWVIFEREYSLRAGKPVYAFTPGVSTVEKYMAAARPMKVFFSAAIEDYSRLEPIQDFMSRRRYFEWVLPHDELERNHFQDTVRVSFRDALKEVASRGDSLSRLEGELSHIWCSSEIKSLMSEFVFNEASLGYLVVFWSANSLRSRFQQDDLLIARELNHLAASDQRLWSKRWGGDRFPGYNEISKTYTEIFNSEADRILFVTLDETPLPDWARHSVQLYGDHSRSEVNRIDDVVVRLYWLMHISGPEDGTPEAVVS